MSKKNKSKSPPYLRTYNEFIAEEKPANFIVRFFRHLNRCIRKEKIEKEKYGRK